MVPLELAEPLGDRRLVGCAGDAVHWRGWNLERDADCAEPRDEHLRSSASLRPRSTGEAVLDLAVLKHLKLQDDEDYFMVISVGRQRHKRYSQKEIGNPSGASEA
jgi:hypothetical protein